MRSRQSAFTLVEIAIVLVIIGLLLGGVLKGQELIAGAKVKKLANDFRVVPTYVYAFQDKFRSLPGDDPQVADHVSGATVATTPAGAQGNGVINGSWDSTSNSDESRLFWQHVRLANLAAGPTDVADAAYSPRNAFGGPVGINSATPAQLQISGMTGAYQVCSGSILGKLAKQLDVQMDDGNTATGSMRVVPAGSVLGTPGVATASVDEAASYTVCMTF
jgi:prepilin-type N-terminal cleavage/methylation domain-containing protein